MNLTGKKTGMILILGSVQYIIALIIAEALYPGYSIADNFISDLGVGQTALIFNISIILFGIIVIIASFILYRNSHNLPFGILLFLSGAGAAMVGLFPLYWGIVHDISAATAFIAGGLAALISYRHTESPFCWISIILGAISLGSLVFFISELYMGIGPGGMERMIVYPIVLWLICYGGYLAAGVRLNQTSIHE